MNKYLEALYRLDDGEHTIEDFELLKKLVKEKDEQESRKDKLVVGSEWECVVRCHGSNTFHCVGELVKIGEIEDTFVWLEDSILDTYVNDSQFLLCFKPR